MASQMQWTWVWVGSESWWWTGESDVLQSLGSQRIGHDWVTEMSWTDFHPADKKVIIKEAKLFIRGHLGYGVSN